MSGAPPKGRNACLPCMVLLAITLSINLRRGFDPVPFPLVLAALLLSAPPLSGSGGEGWEDE